MAFDEVDQLIIERWNEVADVVAAHAAVREKLKLQFEAVEGQLKTWATEQGLTLESRENDGEFWAYPERWSVGAAGGPVATLVVGGFKIDDAFGGDGTRLYAAVYCFGRSRRLSRSAFSEAVRERLSADLPVWSGDTDKGCPLNRYVEASAKDLMLSVDKFAEFVRHQLQDLTEFIDVIDEAVAIGKAAARAGAGRIDKE